MILDDFFYLVVDGCFNYIIVVYEIYGKFNMFSDNVVYICYVFIGDVYVVGFYFG